MQRKTITVGCYEVNCSLLCADGRALIVDPGAEPERIERELSALGIAPEAILLTHGHFDHIGAVNGLQRLHPGLPVYVHPDDVPVLTHPLNRMEPFYPPIVRPENLRDAREFAGAQVIETPGHTPGGVCYYFKDDQLLLSGDTLFAGSVGRTDLPGGDMATLMRSLGKLVTLPDATVVVPGHGGQTTIGSEKAGNMFLQ